MLTRDGLLAKVKILLFEELYQCRKARAFRSALKNQKNALDAILLSSGNSESTPEEFSSILPDCNKEFAIGAVSKKVKG